MAEGDRQPRPARRWGLPMDWVQLLLLCGVVVALCVIYFVVEAVVVVGWDYDEDASACLRRLERVAQAINLYTQDWGGRLPPAERWFDALHPRYVASERDLFCAGSGTPFAMNSELSGATLAGIPNAAQKPLIFETTKAHRNASDPLTSRRREGVHRRFKSLLSGSEDGGMVLFADLEPRFVPDDEDLAP
jgi:hypothetical protein